MTTHEIAAGVHTRAFGNDKWIANAPTSPS